MYFTVRTTNSIYTSILCATRILQYLVWIISTQIILPQAHVQVEAELEFRYQHFNYICEHDTETFNLECDEGRFLYITSIEGYQLEKVCHSSIIPRTSCFKYGLSLRRVQNWCDGKHACLVQASNETFAGKFGDPCQASVKNLNLEIGYSCIEGYCQQFRTPNVGGPSPYDYQYMPRIIPSHADYITFKVRAEKDAHVAFTTRPYDEAESTRIYFSRIVEIVLGGWNNQASAIRFCKQCEDLVYVPTPNLLSPDEERHFKISFKDDYVQVGLVGEEPFMSYQFSQGGFVFNYFGISTGQESFGKWTICNYIPTPTYLGCYKDREDKGRALPNHQIEDYEAMTLEECWAHCRSVGDQRYAGLQFDFQCFCGSETAKYKKYGQTSEGSCDDLCSGNDRQQCGGSWRNSIYDLGAATNIRLVGGDYSYVGRIELFHSGKWSSICDVGWSWEDAQVTCRMLGYHGADEFFPSAAYGKGSGDIIMKYVGCGGYESSLFDCYHTGLDDNDEDCNHSNDVAVRCIPWNKDMPGYPAQHYRNGVPYILVVIVAIVVTIFLLVVFLLHRRKQLRNAGRMAVATVPGSVSAQGQDTQIEMTNNALPSYDAAVVDTHGDTANSNNPDIYDDSTIEDPNLPPPPSYDSVVKNYSPGVQ